MPILEVQNIEKSFGPTKVLQDISFSLGTPWIPLDVYQDFMYETFKTAGYNRNGRYAVELEFPSSVVPTLFQAKVQKSPP